MTATKINATHTHAVVYRGAPYGDNEGGHIVSLHKSEAAAEKAADHYGHKVVVALDEQYIGTKTAREWFA